MDLCGPVAADPSWQARAGEGFDISHFEIDWEARSATSCFTAPLVEVGVRALIDMEMKRLELPFLFFRVYPV